LIEGSKCQLVSNRRSGFTPGMMAAGRDIPVLSQRGLRRG
jgi:hypothetical protein